MYLLAVSSVAPHTTRQVVLVETLAKAAALMALRKDAISMEELGQQFPKALFWERNPHTEATLEDDSDLVWVSGCTAYYMQNYSAYGTDIPSRKLSFVSIDLYAIDPVNSWPGEPGDNDG